MPVLDDLDQRLQRAAGPEPDTEAALAAVLRQLDQPIRRPHRLFAAALIFVVVGGVAIAARWDGGDPTVRTGPSTTVTESSAPSTTMAVMQTTEPVQFIDKPGYIPVVDHEGNFAGYLRDDNPNLEPLPTLDLGTETPLPGGVVVDYNDVPTGYMIAGLGFISNAQAADPAEMERLVAEHQARQKEGREYMEAHPDGYPADPGN